MLQARRVADTKVHLRILLLNATFGTSSRRVSYLRGRGFDSCLEGRSSCQDFLLSLQSNSCKPARCVTYRENSQTDRLLQLLCTNPSTVNHTLMNSTTFLLRTGDHKSEWIVLCNCPLPDGGPLRAETCSICRIIT